MSLDNDEIPPTINSTEIEPDFADKFDLTLGKSKSKKINYVISNTFGFGEHIACSVFKKYQ